MSQQVHIYNQRVVAGLTKIQRNIPLDRIDARQINPAVLGPMPLPTKKLPFRLDQIPFYDTQYMCDPVNPLSRQNLSSKLLTNEDDEPWDGPLQRMPSLTSHLMTYNAYKKEQACQTNWDRMHESDVVYNQSFLRDPNLMRRNQLQSNMYQYQNQNNYNMMNQPYHQQQSNFRNNYHTSTGTGSRRNSLKNYPAPPPPPPPMMNQMRNDASRMNQANRTQNFNYNQRQSYLPQDPVRELQSIIGQRSSMDNSEDEPPFNFKAMLRKTNYSRPENNNVEYNSRSDYSQQNTSFAPKLRSTGMRDFNEQQQQQQQQQQSRSTTNRNYNQPTKSVSSSVGKTLDEGTSATSFEEAGAYVEEEIAPGVTLAGYAIDI